MGKCAMIVVVVEAARKVDPCEAARERSDSVDAGEVASDEEVAPRTPGATRSITGRHMRVQESGEMRSMQGGGRWGSGG
jgi:hypothetical protein